MKIILSYCFITGMTISACAQKISPERFEEAAKVIVDSYNSRDVEKLEKIFSKEMVVFLPEAKLDSFFEGMRSQFGTIQSFKEERRDKAITVFALLFSHDTLDMELGLDQQGKINYLRFIPGTKKINIPAPSRNSVLLKLPFNGDGYIVWGGDTKELNHHHDNENQKYAFDIIFKDSLGREYKTDGQHNEDYFSFGKELLAPADGVITDVIDGVRDNEMPGIMNSYTVTGNTVTIMHGEYEYSTFAHFKQGSIRVKPGEKVKQGQIIGLCGNSGNSSQPHLHFQMQNTPIFQHATTMKCFFSGVIVTTPQAVEKKEYSPVRGDLVRNK